MIDALRQQLRELLIVEYLERAAGRYFADGARMKTMMMIAVSRLHEDRRVGQTFSVNLATHVIQMHTLAYVSPRVLDSRVSIDVRQLSEAESVGIVARICETVDDD